MSVFSSYILHDFNLALLSSLAAVLSFIAIHLKLRSIWYFYFFFEIQILLHFQLSSFHKHCSIETSLFTAYSYIPNYQVQWFSSFSQSLEKRLLAVMRRSLGKEGCECK